MSETNTWERKILSRALLENDALDNPAIASLYLGDFTDIRNALTFWMAKKIRQEGGRVTLLAIEERMRLRGLLDLVGEDYLLELAEFIILLGPGVPTPRGQEVQP